MRRVVRGDESSFNQAYKIFRNKPLPECVEIVSRFLDEKQKACVVANLIDLAMADGILAGAEEKILTSYIGNFQLPEGTVQKIIDVIEVKNNFSVFN